MGMHRTGSHCSDDKISVLLRLTCCTKQVVHLVRHGQSEYNAAIFANGDPRIADAPLTQKGQDQVCTHPARGMSRDTCLKHAGCAFWSLFTGAVHHAAL